MTTEFVGALAAFAGLLAAGWALGWALIAWIVGPDKARRDFLSFHAFMLRPWRHR